MKIIIENIGIFKYAEYEMSDLTIICGKNNTGKTYATYTLYSFIQFFRRNFYVLIPNNDILTLLEKGVLTLNIDISQNSIDKYTTEACGYFNKVLHVFFASQEKYFENSKVSISVDSSEIVLPENFDRRYRIGTNSFLQITKSGKENHLLVSLVNGEGSFEKENLEKDNSLITNLSRIIGNTIKEFIFGHVFPDCFIASAERTGAVIFKNELNIQKNNILKEIVNNEDVRLENIAHALLKNVMDYPLPIKDNIDFVRNIESISKYEGELYKQHPEIIDYFTSIVEGNYTISKNGIYYSPSTSKSTKLTLEESSSSVRALFDVYFYLRCIAKPNDILIIDEPELNLHPESQRRLVKLMSVLINLGIKILITTHSDYIVKELNTLIMLDSRKDNIHIRKVMENYGYTDREILSASKIKMFISEIGSILIPGNTRKSKIQTLVPAKIDPKYGIEATSFDSTINIMNTIQETIIFG